MKAYLVAALAVLILPPAACVAADDKPVTPEVVEVPRDSGATASDSTVEQGRERLPGNDQPGPATRALDKAGDASERAWQATKEGASKAADYTSEKATQVWEATKEGTGKAVDWTKEKSKEAWEATKDTAQRAGDAVKSGYDKTKKKVGETVGNE